MPPAGRTRPHRSTASDATIQNDISSPSSDSSVSEPPIQPASSALTTATAAAQRRRRPSSGNSACFQRASGPTPIRNTSNAINGTNTVSK